MNRLFLAPLLNWARKLKHPTLFKLAGVLFVLALFSPIPLVDELLFGIATIILANWKKDRDAVRPDEPVRPPLDPDRPRH